MSAGVYRLTNLVSKEIYVGYSNNLEKRYKDYKHNRVKTQPLIYKSILTHGFQNHKFDVLFTFDEEPTTNQLKLVESIFIRYYKYWKGDTMLNTNDGGGGSRRLTDSEKEKKGQLRRGFFRKAVLQYDLNGIFIKKWDSILGLSKELSLDYNLLIRCLKNKDNVRTVGGFQWKYDTSNVETRLGQYDLDGNLIKVWTNAGDFLRTTGRSVTAVTGINDVVTGRRNAKTAYGFMWKQIIIGNPTHQYPNIEPYEKIYSVKPVLQYDLDGNFIREWKSITGVSKALNIGKIEMFGSLRDRKNKKYSRLKSRFQWRYKTGNDIPLQIGKSGYPVIVQYSLLGEYVKTWNNIVDATKSFGSGRSSIATCVCGTTKKAKGFQWRRLMSNEIPLKIESVIKESIIETVQIDNEKVNIKLLQYGMDGKFLKAWEYPKQVERETGLNSSSIYDNLKGTLKSTKNFRWKYGDINNIVDLPPLRIICQYDLNNNLIREWGSAKEIATKTQYHRSPISNNISGRIPHAYGFIWAYKK